MHDDEGLGNRKNPEDNEYYEDLWLLEQAAQWALSECNELALNSSSFLDRSVNEAIPIQPERYSDGRDHSQRCTCTSPDVQGV